MGEMDSADAGYYRERHCAGQWREVLRHLATELSQRTDDESLRELMRAAGRQLAAANPLPDVETLSDLEGATNQFWSGLNWGYVRLSEADNALVLWHHCAPLGAGFGDHNLGWTAALLEGAYNGWFDQLGAQGLTVHHQPGPDDAPDALRFALQRADDDRDAA